LLEGVERARANIAENDTQCGEAKGLQGLFGGCFSAAHGLI
jgi:hypothetical protein